MIFWMWILFCPSPARIHSPAVVQQLLTWTVCSSGIPPAEVPSAPRPAAEKRELCENLSIFAMV